ncbi:MAG TPA: glucose 1-dehydrogenase [Acidimicrobiales bacterium]|jgi:NAD(P)-dependent dehydrogenase (short-subunit alcohol dehydrogenase family)|nr:glucose 1-dehydrogenase [Acidimicrobiales bacterium]
MSGRVDGKVAIVTGGGSGIGRATALTLAREGARVVIADLDAVRAGSVAAEIATAGGEALGVKTDVSLDRDVAAMVAATVEAFGALHVLHNNAAITDPAHQARDANLLELDPDVWDRTMAVDLRGVMLGCKHAIPAMIASGGGSIINTSSNAALAGDLTLAAYAAAKGGVNTLTLSVATAFGKQGIRCNAVSPAHIASPSLAANVPADVVAMLEEQCLTPRLGTPQDVANVVLFLASDDASFVTGQIIRVDGGALSHLAHVAQLRARGRTTNASDSP